MTLQIRRVDETVVRAGVRQFCVTGNRVDASSGLLEFWQLETLHQWRALACERALTLGKRVKIEWQIGSPKRFGGHFPKQIVSVEILP